MNIYQMYLENRGAGFWVRRSRWERTVARITFVDPLEGRAPYYNNPQVLADVYDLTTGALREANAIVRCAGNYTYEQVDPPVWAAALDLSPITDPGPTLDVLQREDARRARQVRTAERLAATPKVFLNVPFERKDEVKALGAKWDPKSRGWWLPATNLAALKRANESGFEPLQ